MPKVRSIVCLSPSPDRWIFPPSRTGRGSCSLEVAHYQHQAPGRRASKIAMQEGGYIIGSHAVHPGVRQMVHPSRGREVPTIGGSNGQFKVRLASPSRQTEMKMSLGRSWPAPRSRCRSDRRRRPSSPIAVSWRKWSNNVVDNICRAHRDP